MLGLENLKQPSGDSYNRWQSTNVHQRSWLMFLFFCLSIPNIVLVQEIKSAVCRSMEGEGDGDRLPQHWGAESRRLSDKSCRGSAWWGFTRGMHERPKINRAMVNGLVAGGRRRRHRRGRGEDTVSSSPSSIDSIFLFFYQAVSPTVIWLHCRRPRWERTGKTSTGWETSTSYERKKTKNSHSLPLDSPYKFSLLFFPLKIRHWQWNWSKIQWYYSFPASPVCLFEARERLNPCWRLLELQRKMDPASVLLRETHALQVLIDSNVADTQLTNLPRTGV